MKKQYITPVIRIPEYEMEYLLAGSGVETYGYEQTLQQNANPVKNNADETGKDINNKFYTIHNLSEWEL